MARYPTKNGLCVPIQELGYRVVQPKRKITSNHHMYFYREEYVLKFERVFRSLVTNVVPMLTTEHNDLHERYSHPIVPKTSLMIDVVDEYLALNGVIDLVSEKRTNQTYQITAEQWQRMRG